MVRGVSLMESAPAEKAKTGASISRQRRPARAGAPGRTAPILTRTSSAMTRQVKSHSNDNSRGFLRSERESARDERLPAPRADAAQTRGEGKRSVSRQPP